MATFALVHGAWHRGRCFEPLARELERRGHRAVAPDLPCEDPDAGVAEYADEALVPGFPGGVERDELGRSRWVDLDVAVAQMYADCEPAAARAAAAELRLQARKPSVEPSPLDAIPDVERVSILCREDAAVRPDWSRQLARERLGVEPIELPGGHSPFLARPAELADVLCRLA